MKSKIKKKQQNNSNNNNVGIVELLIPTFFQKKRSIGDKFFM